MKNSGCHFQTPPLVRLRLILVQCSLCAVMCYLFAACWSPMDSIPLGFTGQTGTPASTAITIHFDSGGGEALGDLHINAGDTISPWSFITAKTGQSFRGWYNEDGSTCYSDLPSMIVTEGLTLYAQWTPGYTVRFDTSNSNSAALGKKGTPVKPLAVQSGDPPINAGQYCTGMADWAFSGWYDSAGNYYGGPGDSAPVNKTISADTTLYAHWVAAEYTLTFNTRGGDPVPGLDASGTAGVTLHSAVNLAGFTSHRKGYVFTGWYASSDGAGTALTVISDVSGNQTLYAGWKPGNYRIVFDVNGGREMLPVVNVEDRGILKPAAYTPLRDNYSFMGWFAEAQNNRADPSDIVRYQDAITITQDKVDSNGVLVLYAWWRPFIPVTFYANGSGTAPAKVVRSQSPRYTENRTSGEVINLAAYAAVRDGYGFLGWAVFLPDPDIIDPQYPPEDNWTAPDKNEDGLPDLTPNSYTVYEHSINIFYAQWAESSTCFSVVFDSDGGSAVHTIAIQKGKTITPHEYASVKNGYLLDGWVVVKRDFTLEPNGTESGGQMISGGIPAEGELTVDANLKLKARWRTANYTVTYDTGGDAIPAASVGPGTAVDPNTVTPARAGFSFKGWYDKPQTSPPPADARRIIGASPVYADTTYYAWWDPVYTIVFNTREGSPTPNSVELHTGQEFYPDSYITSRADNGFLGWYKSPADAAAAETAYPTPGARLTGRAYTFDEIAGWPHTEVDGNNRIIYAAWVGGACTITWNSKGGTSIPPSLIIKDIPTSQGDLINSMYPPDPVWTGHQFTGWYTVDGDTNKDGVKDSDENNWGTLIQKNTGSGADGNSVIVTVTADTTYYACWVDDYVIVKFDPNAYLESNPGTRETQGVTYPFMYVNGETRVANGGKIYPLNFAAVRPQHKFLGWTDSTGSISPSNPLLSGEITVNGPGPVILYAQWKNSYTVTFDQSGQGYTSGTSTIVSVTPGEPLMAPTSPQRKQGDGNADTGWIFGGWWSTPAGYPGSKYSFPYQVSGDMTMYARWNTPVAITNVNYDYSGSFYDRTLTITNVNGNNYKMWVNRDGTFSPLTGADRMPVSATLLQYLTAYNVSNPVKIYLGRPASGGTGVTPIKLKLTLAADQKNLGLELRDGDPAVEYSLVPIGTYTEFQMIGASNRRTGKYYQETDLDLLGQAAPWTPLTFAGTFDGKGKKLTNIWISGNSNAGLFVNYSATVDSGHELRNIWLYSGSITGTNAGGIAVTNGGKITACIVQIGTLTGSTAAGGIATTNNGRITACSPRGHLYSDVRVGCIVTNNNGQIIASYNTAVREGAADSANRGYIAAVNSGSFSNAFSNGSAGNRLVGTGSNSGAALFVDAWPTTSMNGWGLTTNNGADGKYWKDLGGGFGTRNYPKLWFEP